MTNDLARYEMYCAERRVASMFPLRNATDWSKTGLIKCEGMPPIRVALRRWIAYLRSLRA